MEWEVEGTDEFYAWFSGLTSPERVSVAARIDLLEEKGPSLGRPYADTLKGSKPPNLKELIVQYAGSPYRVIFAFDPRQTAILLLGGRKADSKWYKTAIPAAEKLYEKYLDEIRDEGLI
jgi:hypothetical protein